VGKGSKVIQLRVSDSGGVWKCEVVHGVKQVEKKRKKGKACRGGESGNKSKHL